MTAESDSRLVWSDERGGRIGGSPSKTKRQPKKVPKGGKGSAGGFPNDGVVRVCREKSGRGGKTVTVLYGVAGGNPARQALLKELKSLCGCGGTLKEGFLEIQGDQREKILTHLAQKGIDAKAAGG